MAPPSSGGINVLQILRTLEPFNISQYPINSVPAVHLFTQASRLAYADREMFIADSDFSHIPFSALVSKRYLADRSRKISIDKDMGKTQDMPNFQYEMAQNEQNNIKEEILDYEEGFRKLYEITGVNDVNEIIQKYITQDETTKSLKDLETQYNEKIEI